MVLHSDAETYCHHNVHPRGDRLESHITHLLHHMRLSSFFLFHYFEQVLFFPLFSSFNMFSSSAIVCLFPALAAMLFAPGAHSHNILLCSNSRPNLELLLTRPTEQYDASKDACNGYPRALPADGTPQAGLVSDQGYPWQGIWPLQDGMAYKTHRAVNWLQQNPVYDPTKKWTTVKPGATIFLQIQTNNHAHEYAERPSGHYKVHWESRVSHS
jgi:hypothetical protein